MSGITQFCTGCRACELKCPKKAISLKQDNEGFWQSEIDFSKCIECGLCQKTCPQNKTPLLNKSKKIFALRNKNDEEIKKSASGGVFAALANHFISNNGVAIGAAYDENFIVQHIAIDKLNSLASLQDSKYVQSDPNDSYIQVKSFLQNGKKVLYSGTPCQIAGLYAFLGDKLSSDQNLLTTDLVCHGVPSPLLFQKYIEWLEKKSKSRITFYSFRTKDYGWGLSLKYQYKNKSIIKPANLDPYYYHFLKGNTYRESCYHCKYSCNDRIADITIGDFWGIEKEHKQFYSEKGVSLALLNTEKALAYRQIIEELFYVQESTFEKAARQNHNINAPTPKPEIRNHIYDGLNELSVENYFRKISPPFSLKTWIKSKVPHRIKAMIKKL